MKRILLAVLALGLFLFLVGCPPSADTTDRFGSGPDREVTNGDGEGDMPAAAGDEGTVEGDEGGETEGDMPEGDTPDDGEEAPPPEGDDGGGEKPADDLAGGD